MLDMHTKNGYLELIPPALVNSGESKGSGQLPKFSNESFKCTIYGFLQQLKSH